MQYFATLPKIVYIDKDRVSRVFTNLMSRANIVGSLLNNPLVFYTYDIQDEDTPEIVAYKYYGDSYRYWLLLYCNQMVDPQWDWPLSYRQFEVYITDKYQDFNPYSTVHHYEKIITKYDVNTLTTTEDVLIIDEDTYNSIVEGTNSYNLPTGTVTVTTTKKVVYYYDYEMKLNESKRNIKILNKIYADQFEKEFKNLMRQ
jgi:hypothetical protein